MQTQTSNTLHNAIIEAGGKDRPPVLAPGNYVQWKSRIKRYIETKPNHELIHYCLKNPSYKFTWADKEVPISKGSYVTTNETYMETYKNVSQDIHDQLNAKAKVVQIILTGIDNDIYSTIDACPNECEMWKAIERLKQGESINVQDLETNLYWEFGKFTSHDGESLESYYSRFYKMMNELIKNQCDVTNHQVNVYFLLQLQLEWQRFVTLVKQSQELKTVSYHKIYDILKQHQNEVNEIRAERITRTANPLALVAQQQPVYHLQNHLTHYTQNSSTRSQQAATRNKGKAIVKSPQPIYDQEPSLIAEDDEMSKDKEIDKLMALISLSLGNVAGARENVGTTVVQKSGIQCYNCKEFRHVARECQKPKRAKDAAYHREKMLLYKQEEARIQLNAEQADWRDDIDDELEDQELDAHYIEHPEQSEPIHDTYPIEQDEHNVIIDSLDISYDREQIDQNDDDNDLANKRELLASLIEKLKCEIDDNKNRNKFLETSNMVLVEKLKDPWNNQFGLYNDGTAPGDYPGHYDNHKRGRSTARSLYHPPPNGARDRPTEPPPAPLQNKGFDLEVDNLALEGVAPELAPKYEASPLHHRKERRKWDSRRPPVFTRIGKKVVGDQTTDLQYLGTHENNGWRTNVHARLGSRDVHDRLGRRRPLSESPISSDNEDSRRKRRKRVSSSSSDSSDNEDEETRHWKSKNGYRNQEDEDMSRPWRRQKVDTFTRRISDFSEDKRRRMPANVKTYDGTGDPDDHLKIFESAATIENWPQPVWCHMFNSTLVGNARNWFSKLSRRSIDGFRELRRAFRLNFTQRKKCAKNPVELARVKQRQGESTSAYVERYKDECIHVKACPKILKISGFMNGINNPELIKRLNDRVSQTFDELMKCTRSFIQGEAAAADNKKSYSNYKGHDIHRMYIDGGASTDILYEHYFQRLLPKVKSQLNPATTSLTGFTGEKIWPIGQIRLLVIVGNEEHSTRTWMTFMVIRLPSPYNGIIGRPGISAIRAVPSTAHGTLKFPVDGGIVTIYNTTVPPRECNTFACDATQTQTQHAAKVINLKVAIHPDYAEQEVSIGGSLSNRGRAAMCALLQRNLDIFAWEPKHMTGVDAGIMREVYYHDWLSNPVMVKKSDGSWRMCVDFTDLNKACQQDCYPLPEIDWKSLNGKLAGLNRFLSKSTNKSLPLFKTLKKCTKKGDFCWTTKAEEAFTQLKQHIATLPTLVAPRAGEELIMYLSVTHGAINAVLLTDRNSIQTPVYFISKALKKTEVNYSAMEKPRTAVKGQILADFIIEKPDINVAPPRSKVKLHEPWILFTDGSSCVDGHKQRGGALIAGLRIATRMGARNLEANVDSHLVANHVLGEYVPRRENKKADALSKITSKSFAHLSKQVLVEILKNKSISKMEISTVIEEQNPTWMTPIIEFISKGTLPHEQKDARRIRRKAQRFELRDGILYRRSFLQPWLQCIGPLQADYVLREIHVGSCSMHSGPRSVVARALRSGYYWPTMHRDARDVIKKCSDCQVHRPILRQPQQQLTPITSSWPFYKWGIDIAGPFPVAAGGLKFLIVAIDYFTKWIEAKAVATITGICEAKAKSKMKGYYDAKVRGVSFRPGDFVYRTNGVSHAEDAGKLGPK
nr:reverse transcriptase domain-containing protein [Tanacetum cinerariifolium]